MPVTVAGLPFDFVKSNTASGAAGFVMKSTRDAYYFDAGVLTKITDVDYPDPTVPGVEYLDGYFFVMDADGIIYNSDLEDPSSWNSLNFLTAESESDSGVAISKHQNYIVAFKDYTTELFYDAANPTGSPLAPYGNTAIQIGCAHGRSVAKLDGGIVFMSRSKSEGRSVHYFPPEGLSPKELANEDIQRILGGATLTNVYSYGLRIDGHPLYVLTLKDENITLVYDLATGIWSQWTYRAAAANVTLTSVTQSNGIATATKTSHGFSDGDVTTISGASPAGYNGTFNITVPDANTFTYEVSSALSTPATGSIEATQTTETYFPFLYFTASGGNNYLLHESNGKVYHFDSSFLDDDGQYIDVKIRTVRFSNSNTKMKVAGKITLVSDKVAGTMLMRHTDDDYQTYSKYRKVSLNQERPSYRRMGQFSRRAMEFRYTDSTRLRLSAIDIDLTQGD
jgi:hypothetical protein